MPVQESDIGVDTNGTDSLTVAARNEAPRYRTATVRESVPLFCVFSGVTMGLRPTKSDEDAGWSNSRQAEAPAPPGLRRGAGVSGLPPKIETLARSRLFMEWRSEWQRTSDLGGIARSLKRRLSRG